MKLFILFLCFTGYSTTSGHTAYSNGTIEWTEKKPSDFQSSLKTTFDAEGLGPWYALANSFINTVLNKDPWGKIGLLRYLEYLRYLVVLFICDLWVVIF